MDTFFFLQVDLVSDPGTFQEFLVCGLYVERLHALSAAIAIREIVMASPVPKQNDEIHIHLLEILFHSDGSRTEITRELIEIIHREVNASCQSV